MSVRYCVQPPGVQVLSASARPGVSEAGDRCDPRKLVAGQPGTGLSLSRLSQFCDSDSDSDRAGARAPARATARLQIIPET